MRKVHVSEQVWDKISELELYLQMELKFSKKAARSRSDKMRVFLKSLSNPADYALERNTRIATGRKGSFKLVSAIQS